jgi:hypothetical protein
MAELEFLDQLDKISFPLVNGDNRAFLEGGELPRQGLIDAGFLLGLSSGFIVGSDMVRLHSYARIGSTMSFDFRSNASGMNEHRFLFEFPSSTDFGVAIRVTATRIDDGTLTPAYGEGYLVVGNLVDLNALGTGTFTLVGNLRIEPALLQPLTALVNTISIANEPRLCPTKPGSSAIPEPDYVCPFIKNLTGDVVFSEGNNSRISVNAVNNTIQFGASLGAGLGPPCEDVIIDENCGFVRGEECDPCDDYIRSFNGMPTEDGTIFFTEGPGVSIENDPLNHRITVFINSDVRTCRSSSYVSIWCE